MRRKISFGLLTLILVLLVSVAVGQTPQRTFTDILTPQKASGDALTLYKSQVEGYLISDGQAISQLQGATSGLPQDEANISTLQQQLAALTARVAKLEAPPAVPGNPAPTPTIINFIQASGGTVAGTTLTVSSVTPPLVLTFSPGNWNLGPNGLSPAADGQPLRNITFSAPVKLVSIVYGGASIRVTDTSPGAAAPNPNAPVTGGVPTGTQVILSTGWANPVTNITIGGTGAASATTLQMQSFTVVTQ